MSSTTSTASTATAAAHDENPRDDADPAAGCPRTDAPCRRVRTSYVIDVDGDGRPDEAWLSGGDTRAFGITTASGATFSTTIESASPMPASAIVNRVQADEIPIALVDLGREALVYSLAGCAVTPVANAQGQPYTFDRGFAGEGTGVGCTESRAPAARRSGRGRRRPARPTP